MSINTKKLLLFSLSLLILGLFLVPQFVFAQASLGLEVGTGTGLGTTDLKEMIVRIVQIILGFLGILAVIVMLYGGFVWMTAMGEADKVDKAKKVLLNGAIGLIIILASFSIVTFIINRMSDVVGPAQEICAPEDERACMVGNCQGTQVCRENERWGSCIKNDPACDPLVDPSARFGPENISPQGRLRIKNVIVRVTFNRDVDEDSIHQENGYPQSIIISKIIGEDEFEPAQGALELENSRTVKFTPAELCEGHEDIYCLEEDTPYRVEVSSTAEISIQRVGGDEGEAVYCGIDGQRCVQEFTTGNVVDLQAPTVGLTRVLALDEAGEDKDLYDGVALSLNALYNLQALANDQDGGITHVEFYLDGDYLGIHPADSPYPFGDDNFEASIDWSTEGLEPQNYELTAMAYDVDNHSTLSDSVRVRFWPDHCFNQELDEDDGETGIDCGGECPICEGEGCSSDAFQCAPNNEACLSGVCDDETCFCLEPPEIISIDPDESAPGNLVTIYGRNFGDAEGTVKFIDAEETEHQVLLPNIDGCNSNWQNNQIIVVVPAEAERGFGQWQVETSQELLSPWYGAEDDERFEVDPDASMPGICAVTPAQGVEGAGFRISGAGFDVNENNRTVYFGNQGQENDFPALNIANWTANSVDAEVPGNLRAGQSAVRIKVGEGHSNGLYFNILEGEPEEELRIISFEPAIGAPGQYVTITGTGFGNSKDGNRTVRFAVNENNEDGFVEGQFNFPGACSTNYWTNNQIIVKVPEIPPDEVVEGGAALIAVVNNESAVSGDDFVYDPVQPVTPGICSIWPPEGVRAETEVAIAGDGFTNSSLTFTNTSGHQPQDNSLYSLTVPGNAEPGIVYVVRNTERGDMIGQDCENHQDCDDQGTLYCDEGSCDYITSNPVNFGVAAALGEEPEESPDYYEWQFTTCWNCMVPYVMENPSCTNGRNASPVPTRGPRANERPREGYDAAFVNSNVGVRFNVDMDNEAFIANQTVILQDCGDGGEGEGDEYEEIPFNAGNCPGNNIDWSFDIDFTDSSPEYIIFDPTQDFEPDNWYRITLTTGITSIVFNPITEEEERVPLEEDYSWYFKTRNSPELCLADSVNMNPNDKREVSPLGPMELGQTMRCTSYGVNQGVCAICPDIYRWDWQTALLPERAPLRDQDQDEDPDNSRNWVYGAGLAMDREVAVISSEIREYLNNEGEYVRMPGRPTGLLAINIVPPNPRVVIDRSCEETTQSPTPWEQYPGGREICINAKVSARFTVPIAADTLNLDNVEVFGCSDQGCNEAILNDGNELDLLLTDFDNDGQTDEVIGFIFTPRNDLAQNATYEVRLTSEEIVSEDGANLVGLNSWQFTTKDSDTLCEYQTAVVDPAGARLILPDEGEATQDYSAIGQGENCQILNGTTPWSWSSDVPSVAAVSSDDSPFYETAIATAQDIGTTYIRAHNGDIVNQRQNGRLIVTRGPDYQLNLINIQPIGEDVCLNALVRAQFNFGLDEGAITGDNFKVMAMGGHCREDEDKECFVDEDCDEECVPSQQLVELETEINYNRSGTTVSLAPDTNNYEWLPNIDVVVDIKGGDRGITSGDLLLTKEGCILSGSWWSDVNEICSWLFETTNERCAVDSVGIDPVSTINYVGEEAQWLATAYDAEGLALTNPMDSWSINDDIADLTESPPYQAITQSLAAGQTWLRAITDNKTGQAQLIVNPFISGPQVIDTKPANNETDVCLNALVGVDFDKYLDENTVNNQTFKINYHSPDLPVVEDGILIFDGDEDYLTIAAEQAQELNLGTNGYVLETWLKAEDGSSRIFEKKRANPNIGWFMRLNNFRVSVIFWSEGESLEVSSATIINDRLWHHIVLVVSEEGQAQLYIDGQADGDSEDISALGDLDNESTFSLGAASTGGFKFTGSIASARIYKFDENGLPGITDYLINWQYQHPLSVHSQLRPNMAADWEMNEGQGTEVADSSAYNHTLNFNGTPVWESDNLPVSASCEQIAMAKPERWNSFPIFNTLLAHFFNNLIPDIFNSFFNFVFKEAYAQIFQLYIDYPEDGYWCAVEGYGEWILNNITETGQIKFQLNQLLPENKLLEVKVKGGEYGVKAANGLPLEGNNNGDDYSYYFRTGDEMCELDHLVVAADQAPDSAHPQEWTFTTSSDNEEDNSYGDDDFDVIKDYDKVYTVAGYSLEGQELVGIPGVYEWEWYWNSEDTGIALPANYEAFPDYYPPDPDNYNNDYKAILAANQNGQTEITAQAVFPPWQGGGGLKDSALAIVDLCENPWPAFTQNEDLRFYDKDDDAGDIDYHFALSYCRDAGGFGAMDDLPSLSDSYNGNTDPAAPPREWVISGYHVSVDDQDDLLKEYIIPVPTTDDVIGLRVYSNFYHLSPQEWYYKNIPAGQQGNPSSLTVNGYPAIQDGRTVYVAEITAYDSDQDGLINMAYTDIFLISYNSDASPVTREIVNQLVERWEFNTNIADPKTKEKIIRDFQRMKDLTSLQKVLTQYNLSRQAPTLLNSSFENGPADWENEGNVELFTTSTVRYVRNGSRSLHIKADGGNQGIKQSLALKPVTAYDMSAWVYVVSGRVYLSFAGDYHGDEYLSEAGWTGWVKLQNKLVTHNGAPGSGWSNSPSNGIFIRSYGGPAEFFVDSVTIKGQYPTLEGGTFVYGMSTSKWPSWSQTLGPELGTGLPTDPLNIFGGCVDCPPIIQNESFEVEEDLNDELVWRKWHSPSTAEINQEEEFVHHGNSSAHVIASGNNGIYQLLGLRPLSTYQMSAWVYVVSGQVNLYFDGDSLIDSGYTSPRDYTGWIQLNNRIEIDDGSGNYFNGPGNVIYIRSTAGRAEFYVDEVTITKLEGEPDDPTCGYDPNTCWNPLANNAQGAFACDAASYFYRYQYQLSGAEDDPAVSKYFLAAKMEMPLDDDVTAETVWFPHNQRGYIFFDTERLNLRTDYVEGCDGEVIGQICGNGVVEPPTEACEPGQHYNWCPLGYNWHTPRILGCQNNCQWLEPNGEFPGYCGGYCGDRAVNAAEGCDSSAPIGQQGYGLGNSPANQYDCNDFCQDTGGYCGDEEIQLNYGEQCDIDVGLDAWDCDDERGTPICNQCRVTCSYGDPYQGACGNNIKEGNEECDGQDRPPHTVCTNCIVSGCQGENWRACDGDMLDVDGCEINILTDVYNCGSCSGPNDRPRDDGVRPWCNTTYRNTIVECYQGNCAYSCSPYDTYLNCDVRQDDCETDYLTSPDHCGGCDNNCAADFTQVENDHTYVSCAGGNCGYDCVENWADCDNNNSCEAGLLVDPNNCAQCERVCPPPQGPDDWGDATCRNGNCGLMCFENNGYKLVDNQICIEACGDGVLDNRNPLNEVCDKNDDDPLNPLLGGARCVDLNPERDPDYVGGNLFCDSDCGLDDRGCCTNEIFETKFTADNVFTLWVNGEKKMEFTSVSLIEEEIQGLLEDEDVSIRCGNTECGPGNHYCNGINLWQCIFNFNSDFQQGGNIIAVKGTDTGSDYGLIGSFSCNPEGEGITTQAGENSRWRCTGTDPGDGWETLDYQEGGHYWHSPQGVSGTWNNLWRGFIEGATPIWAYCRNSDDCNTPTCTNNACAGGTGGVPNYVWCRYKTNF